MAKKVSLDKLLNGALLEMFRSELGRVAYNIHDRNTSAKAKRKITLVIDVYPDDNREIGDYEAQVVSKLCPRKSVKGKFLFGLSATGEGIAAEFNADMVGQLDIEGNESGREIEEPPKAKNTLDFRKKVSANG